jgi:hypothetical protein
VVRPPAGPSRGLLEELFSAAALKAELQRLDRMQLRVSESFVSLGEPALRRRQRRDIAPRRTGGGDELFRLWSSLVGLKSPWQTSSFSLRNVEHHTIDGMRVRVARWLYVHGPQGHRWLGSFISLSSSASSGRVVGRRRPRLRERAWYQTLKRQLLQRGYDDDWPFQDVTHSVFRKLLKDASSAMAEVARPLSLLS